jgi:hypothetical protein
MKSYVRKARFEVLVHLHGVARTHLLYPPLELNWWFLPVVKRWEIWHPEFVQDRKLERLVDTPIVPSLVLFPLRNDLYLTNDRVLALRSHLQQRTQSRWDIRRDLATGLWLPVERVIETIVVPNDDDETSGYFVNVHASPEIRRSLWRHIVGGLLRDEWRRTGTSLDKVDVDK